jgi:hypothetical protein
LVSENGESGDQANLGRPATDSYGGATRNFTGTGTVEYRALVAAGIVAAG